MVDERGWLDPEEFADGLSACNLLPGPASTQLSILCARRVRGAPGALVGGLAFILPGLIAILGLAALFLGSAPPAWVRGAGAGAGAAVAAVAVRAGLDLVAPSFPAAAGTGGRVRWAVYAAAGAVTAVLAGPWVVLVLLACGLAELGRRFGGPLLASAVPLPLLAAAATGGTVSLVWTALKVGALSYGGGFVIVPLMQGDAVGRYHWLTKGAFLNAVALGQVTPGPVVQTVAVVGYAAAGVPGGLLASFVAFAPSFAFVLVGGGRFDSLRRNRRARAFLDGAGPAAIGAILGSAVPLARALGEGWQVGVLVAAAVLLLAARRGVVLTLVAAGLAGVAVALFGGPLPR